MRERKQRGSKADYIREFTRRAVLLGVTWARMINIVLVEVDPYEYRRSASREKKTLKDEDEAGAKTNGSDQALL